MVPVRRNSLVRYHYHIPRINPPLNILVAVYFGRRFPRPSNVYTRLVRAAIRRCISFNGRRNFRRDPFYSVYNTAPSAVVTSGRIIFNTGTPNTRVVRSDKRLSLFVYDRSGREKT